MNKLVNLFSTSAKRDQQIAEIVPLSECSRECDSCSTVFPSSVKVLNDDIYNSAQKTDLHFIVPTGRSDWQHNAMSTPHTVENELMNWSATHGTSIMDNKNVKVSTSSLPIDFLDPRVTEGQVNDVLILPFFVWVKKIDVDSVTPIMNELIPILKKNREEGLNIIPSEVQGFKIEISTAFSYIFLCSHKTRDKRCGITAPLMKKEMDFRLRDTGHYRDIGDFRENGVFVTFINHVGGHKFAANVIIYLRTGEIIWLAKCTPKNAWPIIDETVLGGGKVWGDLVRVVQKEKAIEW